MSNQVFVGQTNLRIELDTQTDLTSATDMKILAQRPNGSTKAFPATPNGNFLIHILDDGDIDRYGFWKFQAYFKIGGKVYLGQTAERYFSKPIKAMS